MKNKLYNIYNKYTVRIPESGSKERGDSDMLVRRVGEEVHDTYEGGGARKGDSIGGDTRREGMLWHNYKYVFSTCIQ